MSKPFLIVNVVDGILGVIRERATFDEAVECATAMAAEQCSRLKDEIRRELETDLDFLSPNGDIHIHIAQAED